jgi:hypothetical protein
MKKSKTIGYFAIIIYSAISAFAGFGMFWYYRIMGSNVMFAILIALFVSALVNILIFPEKQKKKE